MEFMRPGDTTTEQLARTWQNRQSRREPVRLGPVLRRFISAAGLDKPSALAELRVIWDELVGEELADHSRVEGLSRGVLRVEVDSAAHLAELKVLQQSGFIESLRRQFDARPIRSIRLKLGNQGFIGGDKRR